MTSWFEPNTVGDLRRPVVTENPKGDPVESLTDIADGVVAQLVQRDQRTWLPAEGRATVVEAWRAKFRPGTDIQLGDHYVTSEDTYFVDKVAEPRGLGGRQDVVTTLKLLRR